MDRTIDSNKDFMHFSAFYVFFVLKNFSIAKKSHQPLDSLSNVSVCLSVCSQWIQKPHIQRI